MSILVTGGCGFIGSHTCVELLNNNYHIVVLDNLVNSSKDVIKKIKLITNKDHIEFYQGDLLDVNILNQIFQNHKINCVIHFAGLKAVNESINEPLLYYSNNIVGTINLLNAMDKYDCKKIIFSSSATVYGNLVSPLDETMVTGCGISNPYGKTKYMIEKILDDFDESWQVISLRYFNPIGAHPSGLIGENPSGVPNNLMPYILRVGIQNNVLQFDDQYNELKIFGSDYNTFDGTCIRDFIDVLDLSDGHVKALEYIDNVKKHIKINLGTGKGTSVLQLVNTFKLINNCDIPIKFVDRRGGDQESVYCDNTMASELLKWSPKMKLEDTCINSWNFEKINI